MNKREALAELLKGKRITNSKWGNTEFIEMDEDGDIVDETGLNYDLNNGFYTHYCECIPFKVGDIAYCTTNDCLGEVTSIEFDSEKKVKVYTLKVGFAKPPIKTSEKNLRGRIIAI